MERRARKAKLHLRGRRDSERPGGQKRGNKAERDAEASFTPSGPQSFPRPRSFLAPVREGLNTKPTLILVIRVSFCS